MKRFNTTAVCIPGKHYMVDISDRIELISGLIDDGKYFTINRARQYGKTTTLNALKIALKDRYNVISIDFQGIGTDGFKDEASFVISISRLLIREKTYGADIPDDTCRDLETFISRKTHKARLMELSNTLVQWLMKSEKEIVLMIDEVDSASDKQAFLDFLGILRDGYIRREESGAPAFKSVVLAGVTDIKHLKSKMRDEEQHRVNSPWNIAADFDVDMSLSEEGITGMLEDYEADHHTGMDVPYMAHSLTEYTSGYPFLVSRICQILDEKMDLECYPSPSDVWTPEGFKKAVNMLLSERNTLFESLTGKLVNYPRMREALHSLLMEGAPITYNALQESVLQMEMYGFIRNSDNKVAIANRVFETLLYNLFLSDDELDDNRISKEGSADRNIFVDGNRLDVEKILEHFVRTYTDVFGPLQEKFKEKDGRELFLLYLKPIINGTGNYYIEAETRDQTRTDVIVDFCGNQYIIELKIWRGQAYHEKGEKQVIEYLDYYHLDKGYMLSFNFNKDKKTGVRTVQFGDKTLVEAVV